MINEYLIVMEGSGSTGVESSVEKNLADLDLGSSPNPNNSQQHQVVKMAPRPGPMIGGMQEVRESHTANMIFVQNLTLPDFQAKNFTPQKCVICDVFFSRINRVNASNINNLDIFWL